MSHFCTTERSARPLLGVYLVTGCPGGAYPGKGDLERMEQSRLEHGGTSARMVAIDLNDETAYKFECALILALGLCGVPLENRTSGHGVRSLDPIAILSYAAARGIPAPPLGPAVLVSTKWIRPTAVLDRNIRGQAAIWWTFKWDIVRHLRSLAARGTPARHIAVGPNGVIIGCWLIVGVTLRPEGMALALEDDPKSASIVGTTSQIRPVSGPRYIGSGGIGRDAFLAS